MTENSAITAYFNKIGKIPLLTREEETALVERIRKGDSKARDELIERNLKLVIPTAKQYAKCGVPFADLIQEGSMAVTKAADKFDGSRGVKFSTYATYWIKQRIGRYVKKHVKNVFVPEYVINLAVQIGKARRLLAQESVTDPTGAELVETLDSEFGVKTDAKTVRETIESCQTETSMSARVGEDGDTEFGDLLEDDSAVDPSASTDAGATSDGIESALSALTPEERVFVSLRYGIGREPATAAEIAERFGLEAREVEAASEYALSRIGMKRTASAA